MSKMKIITDRVLWLMYYKASPACKLGSNDLEFVGKLSCLYFQQGKRFPTSVLLDADRINRLYEEHSKWTSGQKNG